MRIPPKTCIPAALAALALGLGCSESHTVTAPGGSSRRVAEETFSESLPRAGRSALTLQGITGRVEIVGTGGQDEIVIAGTRRTQAGTEAGAWDALNDLAVNIHGSVEVVLVRTLQPADAGGIGYEVDYEITIPPDLDLVVESVTGPVTIRSVAGAVDVHHVTGTVAILDATGDTRVRLVTGTVHATLDPRPHGTVDLRVVTGTATASVPATTSAWLTASVVAGTVSISGLELVDEDSRPNVVSGALGDGEGTLRIAAVTGGVTVIGR